MRKFEETKSQQEIKLKQAEENVNKLTQELEKLKTINKKQQNDILMGKKEIEQLKRERDDAVKKKAKCC